MKNLLPIFIILSLTIQLVRAQTSEETHASNGLQAEKKNIIKFYPLSPFLGKTSVGYERVIDEKSSLTLNIGLPTGVKVQSYISSNDAEGLDAEKGNLKGWSIMPGYRINKSPQNAPIGFYVEPYLKYENFKLEVMGDFIDEDHDRFEGEIEGKYWGIGAGFQIGAQWLISDVISFDICVGPELKVGSMDVLYTDLSDGVDIQDVYDDLDDALSKAPIVGNRIELEKGSNTVNAKLPGQVIPGLRFAFSFGIAF